MASKETWARARYFKRNSKTDNWGDPDAISDETILRLDDFRRSLGVPIHVLHGVKTSGHKSGSQHYARYNSRSELVRAPNAVDIVVPDFELSPVDLIFEATRFGFTGIGYYPHWRWKGKITGGLHLDCRVLPIEANGTIDYRHNRWMGVLDPNGTQTYIALDFENLIHYSKFDEDLEGMH